MEAQVPEGIKASKRGSSQEWDMRALQNDEDDDNYNESVNNSEVVVVPRMNIDKMNGRPGMVVEHRNSMYEGGDITNTDCDIDLNVNTSVKQSPKVQTNGSDALATYDV